MIQVYTNSDKPVKSWVINPEEGALKQAENLANLPFLFKHVALMPDCHQGYGMPIGGVIATKGVIIPNAVGVDIGCGMCAVQTNIVDTNQENLQKIKDLIRKRIPTGVGKNHAKPCKEEEMPDLPHGEVVKSFKESAMYQLGTLGSGNHFIEIQKGSDGYIWVMIHSGSRNLGYRVANHYNEIAKELNTEWYSKVTTDMQLAFLPVNHEMGAAYLNEMNYCLEFAFLNRMKMMDQIKEAILEIVPLAMFEDVINIHHNYVAQEHHFGENVWVHRKGATLARRDTVGIIPGSQGTKSYIVQGKGNPDSFMSCSHGAGRVMSRTKAQKELNLEVEKKRLDAQGILHDIQTTKDLDEAAGAYKDIDVVMACQTDLVEILVELTPLAVIKG